MTVAELTTVYPAPGSSESPVSLKPPYENFVGGHIYVPSTITYGARPKGPQPPQ